MRRSAALSGVLILLADGLYLWVISQQGASDGTLRVPFVAAYLAACGLAALTAAAIPWSLARLGLLSFSAAGTLLFGVLAIFSIGLILIVVAIPMVVTVGRSRPGRWAPVGVMLGGAVAALAMTVVGLWATEFPVSCPPAGGSGGSGVGFLTGAYHWACVNGKLTTGGGFVNSGGFSGSAGGGAGPAPGP